jgi:multimeric flavodoxin WrbA
VYYFGVTAQLKLVIDRFFALIQEGTNVKRAALLMTCGDASDAAATSSIGMFRQISAYQQWEEARIIVVPGLHTPGEIEGRPELEQARRLGGNI